MIIQILVDNPSSWIVPYAVDLTKKLCESGHSVSLVHNQSDVVTGDILCLLGCEKVYRHLHLNKHNLVVHESDLPKGRGWSPVSWQILEGKNIIPITLFEATEAVDGGPIYLKALIELAGDELWPEIKHKQGIATQQLILSFIAGYPMTEGRPQVGEPTYYPKRTPADSELTLHKTIDEQFNLLRVCDNDRYPAFFKKDGVKYIMKIIKA